MTMSHPSAGELVEAARRFLAETAAPHLTGRDAFLAKVAANALAAVERELSQGPAAEAAARARLARLLGRDAPLAELNAELCRRLRTGAMDLSTPGLLAHLKAATVDQVRIDQPGYSGLDHVQKNRSKD